MIESGQSIMSFVVLYIICTTCKHILLLRFDFTNIKCTDKNIFCTDKYTLSPFMMTPDCMLPKFSTTIMH
jgi:hypothetical protein